MESTYGREDVADAANSLRVGVHRLKRSLVEAGLPQFEYIYTQKGVYHWTSPMPVEVDAIDIKNKILEAGKETDEKARMDQMIEALELYTGGRVGTGGARAAEKSIFRCTERSK